MSTPLVEQCKTVDGSTDLRIGYILYIPTDVNIKKKMNKLLNYVIQFKNPNIYVKSYWEILETIDNISKIKIKTIVLENNKDYAIKMFINELIYNSKKKDKKYNKYLEKIVTNTAHTLAPK
jgi:esterase/lipase